MKKLFVLLTAVLTITILSESSATSDGYCSGKGGDKTIDGITSFWCPLEGGQIACEYKKPTSGCPTAVGGGGGSQGTN
jgi:hypothetical protein